MPSFSNQETSDLAMTFDVSRNVGSITSCMFDLLPITSFDSRTVAHEKLGIEMSHGSGI
jgi:hypothetical protein